MKTSLLARRLLTGSLMVVALTTLSSKLSADPAVTYTITGSANDWTLDFTIDNTSSLGVFDVGWYHGPYSGVTSDPFPGPTSAPSGFQLNGSNWQDTDFFTFGQTSHLPAGATLSGFFALDEQDAVAPTSIQLDLQMGANLDLVSEGQFSVDVVTARNSVPDGGTTAALLGIALVGMGLVSLRQRRLALVRATSR